MLGAVAIATLVLAAPATATVRPLAARDPEGAAPVLAGGSAVYSRLSDPGEVDSAGVVVRGVPLAGGTSRSVGEAYVVARNGWVESWALAGGEDGLALRVAGVRSQELFAGALAGPLRRLSSRVRGKPDAADTGSLVPYLWAGRGAVVTLEHLGRRANRLVARSPNGHSRVISLPRGADPAEADVAGPFVAVAIQTAGGQRKIRVGDKVFKIDVGRSLLGVALVDLASGAVVRRIGAGALRGARVNDVGVGPDGSVAVSGTGDGDTDAVGYAAPGARALAIVHRGGELGGVAPARGRIALIVGAAGGRVAVLRPKPGSRRARVEFRGPVSADVDGLSFDGAHAAWGTDGCQVVADADPSSSAAVLPSGPCVRTEVETSALPRRRRPGRVSLPVKVGCLTAPGTVCHVRLTALDDDFRPLASRAARIRVGSGSTVKVTLRGRALRRARRDRGGVTLEIRIEDPGGRARTAFVF